jgi:hypothetical protein
VDEVRADTGVSRIPCSELIVRGRGALQEGARSRGIAVTARTPPLCAERGRIVARLEASRPEHAGSGEGEFEHEGGKTD